MEVIDAIMQRKSIHSFTNKQVTKETLTKLLEIATRAPSGGNTQPWQIFVAGGQVIEKISQTYIDRVAKNIPGTPEVRGPGRDKLPPEVLARTNDMRTKRAQTEGLEVNAGTDINWERGDRMYGAPIILILCQNRVFSLTYDIGLLTENICLAAEHFGLGTIIAGHIVRFPDVLRQELGIPDDQVIVAGICLGYPDKQAKVNTFVSPRRPLSEVVTFKGL